MQGKYFHNNYLSKSKVLNIIVIIIIIRDHIFSLKHQPKTQLIEILGSLPSQLAIDDINDFWSLAEYYDKQTPSTFIKVCN